MCCVEVAVVSARGGRGCIVVMRWIVVATDRASAAHTIRHCRGHLRDLEIYVKGH